MQDLVNAGQSLLAVWMLGTPLAFLIYLVVSVVAFLFTPVENKRLELAGEVILDSLSTVGLTMKQTATITNMKLFQSGVFMFGRKQRSLVIPLTQIDSIALGYGFNYLWLAAGIDMILNLILLPYVSDNRNVYSSNSGYYENPWWLVLPVFAITFCFVIFWLSGSRRIIVRSKTTSITVDAAYYNSVVSSNRLHDFANRIQSVVVNVVEPANSLASVPVGIFSRSESGLRGPGECSSCGTRVQPGSRFCESCGIPVH